MTISDLTEEARRLAMQDAEDIVRMVERQEREWQRVADAFEQINREMAEHMLRIIAEMGVTASPPSAPRRRGRSRR